MPAAAAADKLMKIPRNLNIIYYWNDESEKIFLKQDRMFDKASEQSEKCHLW